MHDASKNLPEYWNLSDTYYNWTANVRGLSHVLTTVSDAPFDRTGDGPQINALTGGTMGADHPVTWCKDWKGGRSYYTNHGASGAAFNDANLVSKELTGAITWAAGQSDPVYSDCGATVPANYQQSFVAAPPNLSEPIGFDVLPDGTGRVIQTDRRGGVRLHDPATNSTTLLAQLPVYIANEDGMYGPEVDNNFNTNKWVYLFYSPPTVEDVKFADGTLHTVTTPLNDPATPQNEQNAPNFAASLSAWDQYNGYFQLSRFKFVDATATAPAHLDLASEQQILRVPNNRGACCHVAGDIDFDSKNNLWMVTGDDTPAGGGNSGGFGPFNGQLTNESQTVAVAGATGGTFTLTFDGQTTAPIAFAARQRRDRVGARGALEPRRRGGDRQATTRTVNFRGNKAEQNVPLMTGGRLGPDRHRADGHGRDGGRQQRPGPQRPARGRDVQRAARRRPAHGAEHQRPPRQAAADQRQGRRHHAGRGEHVRRRVHRPRRQPLPGRHGPGRAPEVYAMGFRNPFRVTLDKFDVAYVSDYSPDSQTPAQFRGPAGTGRFEIVREPANYGWPLCYKTDLAVLQVGLQHVHSAAERGGARAERVRQPDARPAEHLALGRERRPDGRAGPRVRASDHQPGDLVLVPRQQAPEVPVRHAVLRLATARPRRPRPIAGMCPRVFPELFTGGVGPHGTAPYNYDPANPSATKFPPYWDGAWIAGEFTQDTMREIRMDSNGEILKINNTLPCGPAPATPTRPWLCDNPMDMEFGPDGSFYLLTYGDGFFNINPDAGMMRWDYVKGQRAPMAVLTADKTDGPVAADRQLLERGLERPRSGRLDPLRVGLRRQRHGRLGRAEPDVHLHDARAVHGEALRDRLERQGRLGEHHDHGRQHRPDGHGHRAGRGRDVRVRREHPVHGHGHRPGGRADQLRAASQVTFVLGHDTHGHAEATATGCSGRAADGRRTTSRTAATCSA